MGKSTNFSGQPIFNQLLKFIDTNDNETIIPATAECEVVQFYEIITPEQEPVRIDERTYEVEITRKAPNLYQINQAKDFKLTKYCIETLYCHNMPITTRPLLLLPGILDW